MTTPRRITAGLVTGILLLALAACGADESGPTAGPSASDSPAPPSTSASTSGSPAPSAGTPSAKLPPPRPTAKLKPLRPGERRVTLTMPETYVPSAPGGVGTDDYHCFLLDPELKRDAFITGTNILPGNPEVVHHVILFRVRPDEVKAARALDRGQPGQGWTCFGNTGFGDEGPRLDDAPWLGAWAPGGEESVVDAGFGTRLDKGSMIVMQVHYNLLKGDQPDVSATQLRLAPASAGLTELHTMLLPGPVELPCRKGRDNGPLCDRQAALQDTMQRFGPGPGQTANLLYFLCGGTPRPGPTQSCVRTANRDLTIRAVAGHMHLLGQRIRITLNPGTPRARTLLDIEPWDFDDQGSRPIDPVSVTWSDKIEVTCTHSQRLRDRLPAFESAREDRYVLWGEGTTDEMCLGILTVTTP